MSAIAKKAGDAYFYYHFIKPFELMINHPKVTLIGVGIFAFLGGSLTTALMFN